MTEKVVGNALETKERPSKPVLWSREFITGPVEKDHGDLPLLACCLVTGMVDAATFSNYAVFVGMQTGNTVILGLSTAGLLGNPYAWLTTLVAIASFLIGARATFLISRLVTPKHITTNRLWTSFLLIAQGLFIVISAALATPEGLIPQNPAPHDVVGAEEGIVTRTLVVALIPALGFQSGIQIATSRLLGFNELPVNVLTSTYCDLMGDFKLFALNNVKRSRRAAAVLLLLLGAISSGWIMRSSAGLRGVLWVAAGIKLLTGIVMFVFLPVELPVLPS